MHAKFLMGLSERLRPIATAVKNRTREQFDFRKIEWANLVAGASGFSGPTRFRVSLDFGASPYGLVPNCSICGSGQFCPTDWYKRQA